MLFNLMDTKQILSRDVQIVLKRLPDYGCNKYHSSNDSCSIKHPSNTCMSKSKNILILPANNSLTEKPSHSCEPEENYSIKKTHVQQISENLKFLLTEKKTPFKPFLECSEENAFQPVGKKQFPSQKKMIVLLQRIPINVYEECLNKGFYVFSNENKFADEIDADNCNSCISHQHNGKNISNIFSQYSIAKPSLNNIMGNDISAKYIVSDFEEGYNLNTNISKTRKYDERTSCIRTLQNMSFDEPLEVSTKSTKQISPSFNNNFKQQGFQNENFADLCLNSKGNFLPVVKVVRLSDHYCAEHNIGIKGALNNNANLTEQIISSKLTPLLKTNSFAEEFSKVPAEEDSKLQRPSILKETLKYIHTNHILRSNPSQNLFENTVNVSTPKKKLKKTVRFSPYPEMFTIHASEDEILDNDCKEAILRNNQKLTVNVVKLTDQFCRDYIAGTSSKRDIDSNVCERNVDISSKSITNCKQQNIFDKLDGKHELIKKPAKKITVDNHSSLEQIITQKNFAHVNARESDNFHLSKSDNVLYDIKSTDNFDKEGTPVPDMHDVLTKDLRVIVKKMPDKLFNMCTKGSTCSEFASEISSETVNTNKTASSYSNSTERVKYQSCTPESPERSLKQLKIDMFFKTVDFSKLNLRMPSVILSKENYMNDSNKMQAFKKSDACSGGSTVPSANSVGVSKQNLQMPSVISSSNESDMKDSNEVIIFKKSHTCTGDSSASTSSNSVNVLKPNLQMPSVILSNENDIKDKDKKSNICAEKSSVPTSRNAVGVSKPNLQMPSIFLSNEIDINDRKVFKKSKKNTGDSSKNILKSTKKSNSIGIEVENVNASLLSKSLNKKRKFLQKNESQESEMYISKKLTNKNSNKRNKEVIFKKSNTDSVDSCENILKSTLTCIPTCTKLENVNDSLLLMPLKKKILKNNSESQDSEINTGKKLPKENDMNDRNEVQLFKKIDVDMYSSENTNLKSTLKSISVDTELKNVNDSLLLKPINKKRKLKNNSESQDSKINAAKKLKSSKYEGYLKYQLGFLQRNKLTRIRHAISLKCRGIIVSRKHKPIANTIKINFSTSH